MKRRQGVKTLIQNPFPFPLNSPTRRVKLASLFFPSCQSPFPVRHLLCRLQYTEGQQLLKLWRHLTDHCCQYVFLLIRITQIFRKVHACYTCLCYSGIVRGRLSTSSMVDTSCIGTHRQGGKMFCASFCASLIAGSRRAFLCVDRVRLCLFVTERVLAETEWNARGVNVCFSKRLFTFVWFLLFVTWKLLWTQNNRC